MRRQDAEAQGSALRTRHGMARLRTLIAAGLRRAGGWHLALFVGSLALYLLVGAAEIANLKLDGDEPWYVMLGYSIVHNHTVDLSAIVQDPRLYANFTAHWDDHTKDFLGNGEQVMPNLPGYAAIIGICYALANRAGILMLQAVATAAMVVLLFAEGRRLLGSRAAGLFAALAFIFALPALLYVGQAFPSALASFVAFAGFVLAMRALPQARGARLIAASLAFGACAALLPWLHFKYALMALALVALALLSLWLRLRVSPGWPLARAGILAALLVVGMPLLSFALIGLYSRRYFGTWTPQYATAAGTGMDFAHPNLPRAVALYADMFLSQQSGLLPWVPLYMLVPVGLILLARRNRRLALAILLCLAAQLGGFLPVLFTPAVYQGYALPARFTVECAPFFALAVAAVFAAGWPVLRPWAARPRGGWRAEHVDLRPAAGSWRGARDVIRDPRAMGAMCALALLLIGAWFTVVGAHDAGELYNTDGGNRVAAKYAQVVPAWWFDLFPDPSHQAQYTQTLDLTTDTAPGSSYGWPGTRSVASYDYVPPGTYRVTFTWSCSPSATNAGASDGPLVLVVQRGGGAARVVLAQQSVGGDRCSGRLETLTLGPFASAGYITTGFRVAYSSNVTLTSATATYVPAV